MEAEQLALVLEGREPVQVVRPMPEGQSRLLAYLVAHPGKWRALSDDQWLRARALGQRFYAGVEVVNHERRMWATAKGDRAARDLGLRCRCPECTSEQAAEGECVERLAREEREG